MPQQLQQLTPEQQTQFLAAAQVHHAQQQMAYNERNLVEVVPDYDLNIESSGEEDIAGHSKRH